MNIDDIKSMVFPIGVSHPISLAFDPDTGGLVLEFVQPQPGIDGGVKMRLLFDAPATKQLLSSLPALQKEFGELIEERASKHFLQ